MPEAFPGLVEPLREHIISIPHPQVTMGAAAGPLDTRLRPDDLVTARIPWKGHMLVLRRRRPTWNREAELLSAVTDAETRRYSVARFFYDALNETFVDAKAYPNAHLEHEPTPTRTPCVDHDEPACKNRAHFHWKHDETPVPWPFAPADLFSHDPELVHLIYDGLGFRELANRYENPAQLLEREVNRQKNG